MQISLIRGLLDSPSIIQYSNQVRDGLRTYHPQVRLTEIEPPSPSRLPIGRVGRAIATQAIRYGWYPIRARRVQGDVQHIADHLHAYLVRYLAPERTIVTCHDLTTFVHPQNLSTTSLFPSITAR